MSYKPSPPLPAFARAIHLPRSACCKLPTPDRWRIAVGTQLAEQTKPPEHPSSEHPGG
jgi:hypothetical protein